MTVRVRDRGANAVVRRARLAEKSGVRVGIFGSNATERKAAEEGAAGLTVGQIASYHEFGRGVPERSFIRGYVDSHRQLIDGWIKDAAKKLLKRGGATTIQKELGKLGLKIEDGMADYIESALWLRPLDQRTIDRKRSSTPLIHTGQLVRSISSEVVDGR
jgi:hypothetical protein